MPNTIPDYPPAATPLDGTELVATWQNGHQVKLPTGTILTQAAQSGAAVLAAATAQVSIATTQAGIATAAKADALAAIADDLSNAQDSIGAAGAAAAATLAASGVVGSYAAAMKSALGSGTLKCLFDMDGARTPFSGSATIMTALASLDDTPVSLGLFSTIFNSTDPRPVYTAGRGIYNNYMSGLQNTTDQIITGFANDWAFFYSGDLNVPLFATVNLKADLTGGADGDVSKVIADTRTNLTPDLLDVRDQILADSSMVNGYWKKVSGSWVSASSPIIGYLFNFTNAAKTHYLRGWLNHLGQLYIEYFPGGAVIYTAFSRGSVAYGGRLNFAVRRHKNQMTLWIGGTPVYSRDLTGVADITDINTYLFNGSDRVANAGAPISNGLRHYFRGAAFAQSVPETNFRKAYDVFMGRHAAPINNRPQIMSGTVIGGQSWASGYFNVTDTWLTPSGWNGSQSVPSAFDIALRSPTREPAPGAYAHQVMTVPTNIGCYGLRAQNGSTISILESHTPSAQGEGINMGWIKQINAHPDGQVREHFASEYNVPNMSLAVLSAEPNVYLPDEYKTATLGSTEYLAMWKRQIIYERDWAKARGQRFTVDRMFWLHGHADSYVGGSAVDNPNYAAQFIALYDNMNAFVKSACDQSRDFTVYLVQPNYSPKGTTNRTIKQDQRHIDLEDARGTRPIYVASSVYQWTNYIHPYPLGHRALGETLGLITTRIEFDGERYASMRPFAYTYTVGGMTIDVDYRVRSGEAITFRDANSNNIFGRQTDSGVDTFGYGYFRKSSDVTVTIASPGVVTWAAHGLSNGALVRLDTFGALPTGLAAGTDYFVVNAATNTFQLSATSGGAAINTTGTQAGIHTAYDVTNKITAVTIPISAVTITNANPGVVTWAAHPFANGVKVRLSTTGTLPNNLAAGTDYYVVGSTANTFQLATTPGGTAINTTGTQSGTHTVTSASRVRVTVAGAITANAELHYAGFNCRVGNLCSDTAVNGLYRDQDWTVPLVSGAPQFSEGNVNDLRQFAVASRKVLT